MKIIIIFALFPVFLGYISCLPSSNYSQIDELPPEMITVLQQAFDNFDKDKSGSIPTDKVADILRLMNQPFNEEILDKRIDEVDADKNGQLEFDEFLAVMAKFIVEEDAEE